jgi:hypothetical protein
MMAIGRQRSRLSANGISFQHTSLATTRRYIEKPARRLCLRFNAPLERIKADKAFTLALSVHDLDTWFGLQLQRRPAAV